jgi:hypothetical protein
MLTTEAMIADVQDEKGEARRHGRRHGRHGNGEC